MMCEASCLSMNLNRGKTRFYDFLLVYEGWSESFKSKRCGVPYEKKLAKSMCEQGIDKVVVYEMVVCIKPYNSCKSAKHFVWN